MMFEYIRPIDPFPTRPKLEPVLAFGRTTDAPALAELVAEAQPRERDQEPPSLACPEPTRPGELPRFSGISLADVVLPRAGSSSPEPTPAPPREAAVPRAQPLSPIPEREPLPMVSSLPAAEPRVLLGPGAMTMTLAIVATLAFGVIVVGG